MKHQWRIVTDYKRNYDLLECCGCGQLVPVSEVDFLRALDSMECPLFNERADIYMEELSRSTGNWHPYTWADCMRHAMDCIPYGPIELRFTDNDTKETFYGW